MKTPSEHTHISDLERAELEYPPNMVLKHNLDFKFCQKLQREAIQERQICIELAWANHGRLGLYGDGKKTRWLHQNVDISNVKMFFEDAGWDVFQSSRWEDDGAGKLHLPFSNTLKCFIHDDVVLDLISKEGWLDVPSDSGPYSDDHLWTPYQYISKLRGVLKLEDFKEEIDKELDEKLELNFEVELKKDWILEVRKHLLVPYVREHGWVVEEYPDKIVISYPDNDEGTVALAQ